MPKVILKFELPEEQEEFNMALHGSDYRCVIWDTLEEIRKIVKYSSEEHSDEFMQGLEKAREFIYEQLQDRNLEM